MEKGRKSDFIRDAIREDLASGRFDRVHTRFPPEPNGYIHIGHAKAAFINYSIAQEFGGRFNLRFDDTNPATEQKEYVDAIVEDLRWLGVDWEDRLCFGSDYFEQMYQWAEDLIRRGKAYVCDLSADEVSAYRGTLTEPGRESPYRNRCVEENLDLFRKMRAGEFPDGAKTLRAKIDMGSSNMNLRDPVMYRILHLPHYRAGSKWCIYPTYDWAHGLEDSIEGITHSLCSLEYEDHRPLYDWFLDALGIYHPRQIEFARLNMTYTVLSKRYLLQMVEEGIVSGWDDPRMPTIRGMRRRGYTPAAIRAFCERIGVAKTDSTVDVELLEHFVREDLNRVCPRVMGVLRPLRVVIENFPEGKVEEVEAVNNPEDPSSGTRKVPFSRELFIERDDFMEEPAPGFFRLSPGREVRLRYAYFLKCERVVKNSQGEVVELRCTCDPLTAGGSAPDGRKVKATIHWVSAAHAIPAEVRLYGRLFAKKNPLEGGDFRKNLNPSSLTVLADARVEPSLASVKPGERYQFERKGYFCVDPSSSPGRPVFNLTVSLRDDWERIRRRSDGAV